MTENIRLIWLDIMRILSALAVVLLHVSSYYVEQGLAYGSLEWYVFVGSLIIYRYSGNSGTFI